ERFTIKEARSWRSGGVRSGQQTYAEIFWSSYYGAVSDPGGDDPITRDEQCRQGSGRQWWAKIVALHLSTAFVLQHSSLPQRFHSLCNDLQTQRVRQADNHGGNRRILQVGRDATDKGPVNLQSRHGEPAQIVERRILRPKIVNVNLNS